MKLKRKYFSDELKKNIISDKLESIENKSLHLTSDYVLDPISDSIIYIEKSPVGNITKKNRGFKRVRSIVIPIRDLIKFKIENKKDSK